MYVSSEHNEIGFNLITEEDEYALIVEADPNDGEWHHIAATRNLDTKTIKLFIE